jgi:hypothetical protein
MTNVKWDIGVVVMLTAVPAALVTTPVVVWLKLLLTIFSVVPLCSNVNARTSGMHVVNVGGVMVMVSSRIPPLAIQKACEPELRRNGDGELTTLRAAPDAEAVPDVD